LPSPLPIPQFYFSKEGERFDFDIISFSLLEMGNWVRINKGSPTRLNFLLMKIINVS